MNDDTERDLIEGYLTEGSNGGEALWEILFLVLLLPFIVILKIVRLFRGR